jgi:hypothetical protein
MNQDDYRTEVLELLAKGKISIDEAVNLLDRPESAAAEVVKSESLTDINSTIEVNKSAGKEVVKDMLNSEDLEVEIEDIPMPVEKPSRKEPRWLRIHVGDLTTGKSKVKVNIPFGMVKFGLGLAQIFAPQEYGSNFEQIGDMMAEADSGVLVDVQDVEDNEHVRIYFE